LPKSDRPAQLVFLSGERLYAVAEKTLYVYSVSDPTSPVFIYQTDVYRCYSGIIADNRFYLGGDKKVRVYEVTANFTQPLILVKEVQTKSSVYKFLRVGHELLLGECCYQGYLEVFDIETSSITSTHKLYYETIRDIIAIDNTQYFIAARGELLKTTKDQLIESREIFCYHDHKT
jgi:hypothetical protein